MKKGFTLIELLAIIAILAIVLLIAVPFVINVINNVRNSNYLKNEQMMSKATMTYLASNQSLLPINIGDITVVNLSDLKTANFITDVIDPKDNTACTGKVVVSKKSFNEYTYNPYLDCGANDYQTNSYVTSGLILYLDGYDAPVGGYWTDKSSSGSNAQLLNMAGTPASGYNANQKGYTFDGTNDYMRINANPIYNTNANGEFSYSVWFKASNYNARQSLLTMTCTCNNPGTFEIFTQYNQINLNFYSDLDAAQGSNV